MVEMNRISTAKKSVKGIPVKAENGNVTYTKNVIEGNGMYVFVYGNGSKRKSETKHMSESQARIYKEQLERAGY
jgi:hypothetical protein